MIPQDTLAIGDMDEIYLGMFNTFITAYIIIYNYYYTSHLNKRIVLYYILLSSQNNSAY